MREITRHNYEEFFLDYLEGTMSSVQRIVLDEFLSRNPDLKLELEEMEWPVLNEERANVDFESLKEIPFQKSFDDFCIARMEGDLSLENELAFDAFVEKHEVYKKEQKSYRKTILYSDNEIVFVDKKQLKRDSRKIGYLWYFSRIGIAASIILLFSLWNILFQYEGQYPDEKKIISYVQPINKDIEEVKEPSEAIELMPIVKSKQVEVQLEKSAERKVKSVETLTVPVKKEPIEIEEVNVVHVAPPGIAANTELIALSNTEDTLVEIKRPKMVNSGKGISNNGLSQLGMSWKSSVADKKSQNSVLYAIAKYGVDKLGEIAGKKVQLEKNYDSATEKTRLDFNTSALGFSKTIK